MVQFQSTQHQFSAHLRDPNSNPPPDGIEERRLQIYRDLFYNNVQGFLAQGFPVLHRILEEKGTWHGLVRRFYANHRCESPYFLDIPGEFIEFLTEHQAELGDYPAYMLELAHYEWLEMVLDVSMDEPEVEKIDFNGDLLANPIALTPNHVIVQYQWPVTRISLECQPSAPLETPVLLILFRDRKDKVRFLEVNAITQRLVGLIAEFPEHSGHQHLEVLADELPQLPLEQILRFGRESLERLRQQGLILGTFKNN